MPTLSVQVSWIIITVTIAVAVGCIIIRLLFLYVIKKNVMSSRQVLANFWLFQSEAERTRAKLIASGLENKFKEGIPAIAVASPQFVAATMNSDHTRIEVDSPEMSCDNRSHWPVFRIALNGMIEENGLVVSDVPSYDLACRLAPLKIPDLEEIEEDEQMLSAEVLRRVNEPLSMNTSLNRQDNQSPTAFNNHYSSRGGGLFGGNTNTDNVPYDRPLFVNTMMSAQHRIDLYRQLAIPPQDDQPALNLRFMS